MKPLSQKTLEKRYAALGISAENLELLHKYYLCFSNLYGMISVGDAWPVYRHFEGLRIHKKDFVAFSGVVQREGGLPYSVLELKEVYSEEESDDPEERMIVDNRLIERGYGKYRYIYKLEELQYDKPYFLPDSREEMLQYTEDQFYLSPAGRKMKKFIEALRTNGTYRGFLGNRIGEILDLDGNPVKGKRLSDFEFRTPDEEWSISYYKKESMRSAILEETAEKASEKALDYIFFQIQISGRGLVTGVTDFLQFFLGELRRDFGVELNRVQFEEFVKLYFDLNNSSHMWQNCGCTPEDLRRSSGRSMPSVITLGPNMRQMIRNGEMDPTELIEYLSGMGIELEY